MINFQTLEPSMAIHWRLLFDITDNADGLCTRLPAHYWIGKCHYILPYGTPKPVPLRYHKRKQRYANRSDKEGTALAYMKWKYPKNKQLQEQGSIDLKVIKDETTGKPRFIRFFYGRRYNDKKKSLTGLYKSFDIEIPHWDFNAGILEEITR